MNSFIICMGLVIVITFAGANPTDFRGALLNQEAIEKELERFDGWKDAFDGYTTENRSRGKYGCTWVWGDGKGEETKIQDTTSEDDCIKNVQQKYPNAQATWGVLSGGRAGECYAEVGSTGSNNAVGTWKTCVTCYPWC